ncbi:MAG TPA: hypothetical protein PLP29_05170 [Candidatus Ozemobacteraceae bacterium]|nr:hypothetical protein [Candidatus Ozemobacteraceae bacterium]
MRPLRLLLGITILCLSTLGAIWLVLSSASGNAVLAQWAAATLERNLDAEVRLGPLHGSVLDRLTLEGIHGVLRRTRLGFASGRVELNLTLRDAIRRGLVIDRLECPWVRVWGAPNPGWLADLPDLPPFQCQVVSQLPVGVNRLRLGLIEWMPAASGPVEIGLASLSIDPITGASGTQPVEFDVHARFKGIDLFAARFTGELHAAQRKLRGRLDGRLALFPVGAAVRLELQRDGVAAEIGLDDLHVSLASLTKWLDPLWKKNYPLAFSGEITGSGTWIYQPKMGMLSGFQGQLNHVVAIMTGFNLSLAEVNADWRFFDGRMHLTDRGCQALGFPASITGSVGFAAPSRPDWSLELSIPEVPLGELVATLPWALRYGYGVPELDGTASLSARIDGPTPGILVNGSALVSLRKRGIATSAVMLRFRRDEGHGGRWDVCSAWTAESELPDLLRRIRAGGATIGNDLQMPIGVVFEAHGPVPDRLETRIGFAGADGTSLHLAGDYEGGVWSGFVTEPGMEPATLSQGLTLPDFLLPGW